ncbi:amino acid adenylation [uncultured Psychrosphaera sp.]|uniref:amino acid adenylation n=1 Tax=uncultured Psychrosphaera sp. TaxID=1403522 RepID=UPI00262CEE7E|nr:amino acid adenylation [uncultured Psychrosphaera sp.]
MKLLLTATNALNKWLNTELPRLPVEQGKQAGVNTLISNVKTFSWQVHIIDNHHRSYQKTIIACEANSRFLFFIPVTAELSQQELTETLQINWQLTLAATLENYQLMPNSDIAYLLSVLSQISFTPEWVKNNDLSINGHICDAAIWISQTLEENKLDSLTPELALELTCYLNTQIKRVTNKQTRHKEKFIPIEQLLIYCKQIISSNSTPTTDTKINSDLDANTSTNSAVATSDDAKTSADIDKKSNVIYISEYKH